MNDQGKTAELRGKLGENMLFHSTKIISEIGVCETEGGYGESTIYQ